jgi:uncharacterized protein (TIGR03083 family)
MSTPPPPHELAAEYASARARIRDVVHAGDPSADAAVRVPACPDWTVADLLAHLAGVAASLVARDNPGADVQAWIDAHVAARRGRSVVELCDEWDEVGPAFEALIVAKPAIFGGLLNDAVAHEHDLRGALVRPGARHEPGVRAALALGVDLLARDLDSHGLPGVRIDLSSEQMQAGADEPALTLTATPWEAMRLLGSRRTRAEVLAAAWSGPDVAHVDRYLPALAHLPLPVASLDET